MGDRGESVCAGMNTVPRTAGLMPVLPSDLEQECLLYLS